MLDTKKRWVVSKENEWNVCVSLFYKQKKEYGKQMAKNILENMFTWDSLKFMT